jgi:hypothetical protein
MNVATKILKLIITVFILSLLFSCSDPVEYTDDTGDSGSSTTTTGLLRFIHAASSTDNFVLDYRDLDTDSYEAFLNSPEYGFQYGYYNFRTGEREFAAFEANTSIKIAQTNFDLDEDKKYSIIAYDYDATINPGFLVLEDTLSTPDSIHSFVRFLHVASDVGTIEIEGLDQVLVELGHNNSSKYFTVSSNTYFLIVRLQPSDQTLLNQIPATFIPGVSYTVILSGSIDGMTPVDFNMKILRDASIKYITVD